MLCNKNFMQRSWFKIMAHGLRMGAFALSISSAALLIIYGMICAYTYASTILSVDWAIGIVVILVITTIGTLVGMAMKYDDIVG